MTIKSYKWEYDDFIFNKFTVTAETMEDLQSKVLMVINRNGGTTAFDPAYSKITTEYHHDIEIMRKQLQNFTDKQKGI